MKVYVLSTGEHADWSILGIFSSLEALEAGKLKLDGHWLARDGFNDPEEYEVDAIPLDESGPTRWRLIEMPPPYKLDE